MAPWEAMGLQDLLPASERNIWPCFHNCWAIATFTQTSRTSIIMHIRLITRITFDDPALGLQHRILVRRNDQDTAAAIDITIIQPSIFKRQRVNTDFKRSIQHSQRSRRRTTTPTATRRSEPCFCFALIILCHQHIHPNHYLPALLLCTTNTSISAQPPQEIQAPLRQWAETLAKALCSTPPAGTTAYDTRTRCGASPA